MASLPQEKKASHSRFWRQAPTDVGADGAEKPKLDNSDLTIDAIMSGNTKLPIRLSDFKAFLHSEGELRGCQIAAVAFLEELKEYVYLPYLFPAAFLTESGRYEALFDTVPLLEQPPHPYVALDHSLAPPSPLGARSDTSPQRFSSLAQDPMGISADHVQSNSSSLDTLAIPQPTARLPESPSIPSKSDVSSQPLFPALQNIIANFLQHDSRTPIVGIVPRHILDLALSQTKMTTHPATIGRLAPYCTDYLTARSLAPFLNSAVRNLGKKTSQGRLCVSILALLVAIGLTAFLVVWDKTHAERAWRLCTAPLYVLGIGYAIGSRTGLCFWLAWRGTREAMWYERAERAEASKMRYSYGTMSSTHSRSSSTAESIFQTSYSGGLSRFTSSDVEAGPAPEPPSFIAVVNSKKVGLPSRLKALLIHRESRYSDSDAEKGILHHTGVKPVPPPPVSLSQYVRNLFSSRYRRGSRRGSSTTITTPSPFSPTDTCPAASPLSSAYEWKIRMKIMAGSPAVIEKVEDERIKRIQLRIAVKVAVTLVGLSMGTMVAVWFIPCPRQLSLLAM